MNIKISKRLRAVANFVKKGSVILDVGTDHAYLPIYLVKNGIVSRAYASDVNDGPIIRAQKNISDNSLEKNITAYKAYGLCGVEEHSPDTVIIAGMGGELIRDIIGTCEYVKENRVSLILQPMTQQPLLRKWLWENGFCITDEELCIEDKRIYQIICAVYSGEKTPYDETDAVMGKINIKKGKPELKAHIEHSIHVIDDIIAGKSKSGANTSGDSKLRESFVSLHKKY